MGILTDEDVQKLLIMIDPETWDPTFDRGKLVHQLLFLAIVINLALYNLQKEKMNIQKV